MHRFDARRGKLGQTWIMRVEAQPGTTNDDRPAFVIVSTAEYEALLEELDDLEDRLSVHERDHLTVDFETLRAEF